MHTHSTSVRTTKPALLAAVERLVDGKVLEAVQTPQRCWSPWLLMLAAVLMSWESAAALGQRFQQTKLFLRRCWPRKRLGGSYQGLKGALARLTGVLLERLVPHLRGQMQALAAGHWYLENFAAFSPDGSKFDLPRTRPNKRSCRPAGRPKSPPQLLLTVLYHLGSGLPWDWRIRVGRGSERRALGAMLGHLPPEALLVADAGFVGYELLRHVLAGGRHVLMRVGANVQLLQGLGYAVQDRCDTVYLWPQQVQRQGRRPLVLRKIVLDKGRKRMVLLTDIQDRRRLGIRRARRLYAARWGVETLFRALKQTLEHRKLRSRTPAAARVELTWSLVGLWLLGLLGVAALRRARAGPRRLSLAAALRAVRLGLRGQWVAGRLDMLERALRASQLDQYTRSGSKRAHRWPHKKKDKPCGLPKLRQATAQQIQRAQELANGKTAA